jgi:hypothetical protein
METQGIRILDSKDNIVSVKLHDILEEIPYEDSLKWSILYLTITLKPNSKNNDLKLEEKINNSKNGYPISWLQLNELSKIIHQEIELIVIASKEKQNLRRYKNDQEMYETCDIVIEMFDSCFWEVFSKDKTLIDNLAKKFKETKLLESDFEK